MDKKPSGSKAELPDLEGVKQQLLKERAQYDAKKEAFEGLEEKLNKEFESGLDASLSDEERDVILEGNVLDIARMIDAKRQAFVGDRVNDERKELELMEDALEQKEERIEDLEAEASFRKGHPDLDTDGFAEYLRGEMSPNQREKFLAESKGDKVKFLGLAAKAFLESMGTMPDDDPKLPTDISNIAGATGDVDNDTDDTPDNDYLASVGL